MADRIVGCPHEEGADYLEGETCQKCPFWEERDRWSGELQDGSVLLTGGFAYWPFQVLQTSEVYRPAASPRRRALRK